MEAMKMVKLGIRVWILVIFLGYIMIWIMMPTNTFWLHWLPQINAMADSTYFGQQGANILIYTFPVLLIATLGCIYLHLEKKYVDVEDQRKRENYWWKRPVFVKGPLGIVCWTELLFVLMFIGLLLWSFSAYLHGMFANITSQSAAQMGQKMWEAKLESCGLMLGLVGNICLAFLFFPVTRGSSVLQLMGLTSESSVKYHIWVGHTAFTLFTAHALSYIIFWANTHQISQMLKWSKVGVSNVAGEISLLCGLAMWVTSLPITRRNTFELFFYTHHLYITFIVFFIFHVGFAYSCVMLPGFYLFLIDRFLRFLQSRQQVRLVSARVLPCEAVELNFTKSPGLSYNPTSTIFLNLPSISKLQWHPFTVTSSCNFDPEKLSVVIKSEGSWSRKLYAKLSSSSTLPNHLQASIEGPYGPTSSDFLRHDMIVMVSGGSGITPFISIIRELISLSSTHKPPRLLLIAAFKKSVDLTLLDLILPASGTPHTISHLQLQIEVYITRENQPYLHNQKPHQNIWFEPKPMDVPLSEVLGRNSWLWLSAIISSSFIVFLLLIGILTRFYIYPIDHNTNMVYSYALRSVLNMAFVCASIVLASSVGFLWNKRQNAKEMGQIQNVDALTPVASPGEGLRVRGAERELESIPQQSLFQDMKVHYGERPNLKKILLECGECHTKVLVSGPKKMRQEVAAICSSTPADNLNFESITFSW